MKLQSVLPLSVVASVAATMSTSAAVHTYYFTGKVEQVSDNRSLLPSTIRVGNLMTGRLVYDDSVRLNDNGDTGNANVTSSATLDLAVWSGSSIEMSSIVGEGGGFDFLNAQKHNDDSIFRDRLSFSAFQNSGNPYAGLPTIPNGSSRTNYSMQIALQDRFLNSFSDLTSLPNGLNLSNFDIRRLSMAANGSSGSYNIQANIETLGTTPVPFTSVPEPSTSLLASLAGLSLFYRRRRC